MRVFHINAEQFVELDTMPAALPAGGFLWVGSGRREFEIGAIDIQNHLQAWTGGQLVDLHVRDLLSQQLPSNFDSTSWYDLLVFRRLAVAASSHGDDPPDTLAAARKVLESIDTSPVGFAVFDRVLVSRSVETLAMLMQGRPVPIVRTRHISAPVPRNAGLSRCAAFPHG